MAFTYRRRYSTDSEGNLTKLSSDEDTPKFGGDKDTSTRERVVVPLDTPPPPLITAKQGQFSGLVPIPKLYNEDGSLNKHYDTSIVSDMLSGINIGGKAASGGDSLRQLAGQIGGLLGGIFSKNIAGKQKFSNDMQLANAINEAEFAKTNAQVRVEVQQQTLALRQQAEARKQEWNNYKIYVGNAKTRADKLKAIQTAYNNTTDPDNKRAMQTEWEELSGMTLPNPDKFGKMPDYDFRESNGFFIAIDKDTGVASYVTDAQTGKKMVSMSPDEQLRAVKTYLDIKDSSVDVGSILQRAKAYMSTIPNITEKNYTNVLMQLVRVMKEHGNSDYRGQIIINDGTGDNRVISLPEAVNIGLQSNNINTNTNTNTNTNAQIVDNSQFMSKEAGDYNNPNAGKVTDAASGTVYVKPTGSTYQENSPAMVKYEGDNTIYPDGTIIPTSNTQANQVKKKETYGVSNITLKLGQDWYNATDFATLQDGSKVALVRANNFSPEESKKVQEGEKRSNVNIGNNQKGTVIKINGVIYIVIPQE